MGFWGTAMIAGSAIAVAAAVFLVVRVHSLGFVRRLSEKRRVLGWCASLSVLLPAVAFLAVNLITALVVLLHMTAAFILLDMIGLLIRLIWKKRPSRELCALAACALALVYLGVGWINFHHVRFTTYEFTTAKELPGGSLRIVGIADAHLSFDLDGEGFAREMERVKALEPDIVCVMGDLAEDSTTREDMLEAARALGGISAPLGVYYVSGNHDAGYGRSRAFSFDEMTSALEASGVTVLSDECAMPVEGICIAGRRDRSSRDRLSAGELIAPIPAESYVVMLDHQPNDYAAEAESGADLVLSGHSHGGHMFPAGQFGLLIGANDRMAGTETRGDTHFIVSAGISGWGVPFKTGTASEIVVVDVREIRGM